MASQLVKVSEKDFLDEDPEIVGQHFVCLSFLSPESVLVKKDTFMFSRFMTERCNKLGEMLQELADLGGECSRISAAFKDRHADWLDPSLTHDAFNAFASDNEVVLNREFSELNQFQTSVRGIKVRGCYDSLQEAQGRCEAIRGFDPNFDVYVATVGAWCPWNPAAESMSNVEYSETELNTLMKSYKENQAAKAAAYTESTASKVSAAIAEGTAVDPHPEPEPAQAVTPSELMDALQNDRNHAAE